MDTDVLWIWIGVITGGVIGLLGGMIGTYFSIKNTNGPHERAFMVKASVVTWTALLFFFILIAALPNPYRWLMWIPYGILMPLGIIYSNRKQQEIRQQETQNSQQM
jgi:Ca2+/Na+ antiporter